MGIIFNQDLTWHNQVAKLGRPFEIPTHHGARLQDPRMLLRRVLQSENMLHVVPYNWQWQAWVFV
jgi:hypothetical protein